jgi:hypothetical protein
MSNQQDKTKGYSINTKNALRLLVLIVGISFCLFTTPKVLLAAEAPFSNPSESFQEGDLVGIWETRYSNWGVDTIIIREDGTYKQIFKKLDTDYSFETPWNPWQLEAQSDGRILLHLNGGLYFKMGPKYAEKIKTGITIPIPCPDSQEDCQEITIPDLFYDPVAHGLIEMNSELILNVRMDRKGAILLTHMWTSSDRGFAIFGGEWEIFRKNNPP